jgi:hypothetical protein
MLSLGTITAPLWALYRLMCCGNQGNSIFNKLAKESRHYPGLLSKGLGKLARGWRANRELRGVVEMLYDSLEEATATPKDR